MIRFIFKGLMRDKHRSLFPIIIVTVGVAITSFVHSYLNGVMDDFVLTNASFDTGHVKVMTRAYAEISDQCGFVRSRVLAVVRKEIDDDLVAVGSDSRKALTRDGATARETRLDLDEIVDPLHRELLRTRWPLGLRV